jgi:flagellar biosynthesis/type III secretory pathway M-ring protein FliF/YscJ
MTEKGQGKSSGKAKNEIDEFFKSVQNYLSNMSDNDKIAYGLIILGVILLIIGIILW